MSEPITIETWTKQENGFVIPTLNLNADKSYVFKGVMGVDNTPFEVKSSQTMSGSEMGMDGAIAVFTDAYNEVLFLVYDKMLVVDNEPVIDDSKAQIQIDCTDLSRINNTNQPITLESIVEVEASAKPIVTFSAEDSDTYDESMGMYIKTLDTPVDTSAFAHNTKVKLNFTLNGEAISAEGYMIKETDSEGTYIEYISMRSEEDGGGAMFALVNDEANQKSVALMNYLNMNMLTEQAGATFGFMVQGYDPLPTIEILSITEA